MKVVWEWARYDAKALVVKGLCEEYRVKKVSDEGFRGFLCEYLQELDLVLVSNGHQLPARLLNENCVVVDDAGACLIYIKDIVSKEVSKQIANSFGDILDCFPCVDRKSSDFILRREKGTQKMVMAGLRRYPYKTGRPVGKYAHTLKFPSYFYNSIWKKVSECVAKWIPNVVKSQGGLVKARLKEWNVEPLESIMGINNIGISNRYQSPFHRDDDVGVTIALSNKCGY